MSTNSSQDALLTKRERGKLAQRAYRKRHTSRFQTLQLENERLKAAIREISRAAASNVRPGPQLQSAIASACQVAGVTLEDESKSGPGTPEPQLEQPSTALTPTRPPPQGIDTRNTLVFNTGRLSPRLDYGLWLDTDRVVRVFDTPADVAPYLGDGMYTLAGCIYWACLAHTVSAYQRANTKTEAGRSEHRRLQRIFNHTTTPSDYAFIVSLAEMRLEFRRKGYIHLKSSENDASKRECPLEMRSRINQELARKGMLTSVNWWRSPEEVADYVEQQLGPERLEYFKPALLGDMNHVSAKRLGSLIRAFAGEYTCFGEGPRWHAMYVSLTVGGWLDMGNCPSVASSASPCN